MDERNIRLMKFSDCGMNLGGARPGKRNPFARVRTDCKLKIIHDAFEKCVHCKRGYTKHHNPPKPALWEVVGRAYHLGVRIK